MFGVRHRRRIVTVVVATWLASTGATGLPGSDMVLGAAGAVGAQTAGGPPALSWQDPAPPELVVPEVPAGEGEVPDDWAAPVPAVARRPAGARVRELVDQRTATREVWENADGTRTAVLHSQPVFYQPAAPRMGSALAQPAGGWEPIDTALVADPERPGWLRTGANGWAVRFGPIEPGAVGGVELETGAGRVRIVPDLAEGHAVSGPVAGTIAPVPGTGDAVDAVTYPNVWPGVDLVYRTTGATLRQQIVLREAGCETVRFVVEGLDLQETDASRVAQTVEVTGPQAGVLALQPLDVGRGADAAVPAPPGVAGAAMRLPAGAPDLVGDDPDIPGEPQFLAMSVAGAWLDRVLHAGEGPVVVGSTTTVGSTAVDTFRRLGAPTDTAAETLTYHDGLRVGRSSGDGQPLWRATARYDYWPFVEGRQVLAARLTLGGRADRNAYAATVSLRGAAAASFDGADGPPADGAGGPPVEVAPGTPETPGADDVAADATDLLHRWQREARVDGLVGLVGDEASPADTYLRFDDPTLEVTVNDAPAPPLLQAPAGDALAVTTTTPTLTWGPVADPDGGTVTYTARIATGPDADSGLVVSSPPSSTATSWQVPVGVLRDGTVYYWRVIAGDGRAWTASEVRRLTVDSGLGVPATAPVDTVGAVTTNLASGNAFVRVPGASLPSASGSVDVDLVYNSATPRQGLTAVYREDDNRNTEIDSTDPIRLARTDSQVSFAWRKPPGSAVPPQPPVAPAQSPAPGVPGQWFSAQWTGSLALPTGNWQLGARADDGVRIRLDDETVLDRWAMGVMPSTAAYQDGVVAGDSSHTIEVDYFQAFEGAGIELWVRSADDPSVAFVLPAGWLTPTSAPAGLPAGWSLPAADASAPYSRAAVSEGTVTLFGRDGGAKAFTKTVGAPAGGGSGVPTELGSGSAGTAGYRPPPGTDDVVTVGLDGSVTVQSPGGTTSLFRPDGGLRQVTSAAGDHAPLAADAAYDSAGRLERLTDPVSGRSSILRYAPSPDCADAPELSGVSGLAAAGPGMLCRIDHWDGTSSSLHYAANGLLAYVRRAGEIWGFGYDASGRLSGYVDPLAVDATLAGAPEVSADAVDHVIGYDPTGRVVSVARPPVAGDVRRARSYAYAPATDASGLLTDGRTTITCSGVDGAFRVVGYDQRGRLVSDTDAAGATTTTAWNDDDQVVATDAPDGLRTTTSFDALGRPVTAWGPAPAAMFNVDGTGQDVVPRVTTGYDEQFDGLRVDYWINVDLVDGPVRHGFRPGTLSTLDWGTGSPADGIPADGWGARLTGHVVFPEPGTYRLRLFKEGRARLFLDDTLVMDGWDTPSGWSADVEVTTVAPDEARRLRVDYAKSGAAGAGAPAGLEVLWTPPGAESPEPVPPSTLRPAFNLLTSTVNADGIRTERQWIDEAIGMGPHHRRLVRQVVDPAGLHLVESWGYEPVGAGRLREVARTRPAGPETTATITYYGDAELRDNPCTREGDRSNQAGLPKRHAAPDPDGDGPRLPVVQETIYGPAGRVVATRFAGETDWTCISYDDRGRIATVSSPAASGQAARTVTHSYAADPDAAGPRPASPLTTSVSDPAGSVVTETNVLAEPVRHVDVIGNATVTTYDELGRQSGQQGPGGTLAYAYDSADRLTTLTRDGQTIAADLAYDVAGRLVGVAFPGGAGAGGNGTGGTLGYDTFGRPASTSWSGSGGVLVTSDVVARRAGGGVLGQVIDGVDQHPGDDFVYDGADRLVEAWMPGRHLSFQFAVHDGCGPLAAAGADSNRTHQLIEGGPVTCYCYDRADQLTAADTATGTVTYDLRGNVTAIFGETLRHDGADRLVERATESGPTLGYVRDGLGRVVERTVDGSVVARYGYADATATVPAFTTGAANTVLDTVVPLPGGALLVVRPGGADLWAYPNVAGDLVAAADPAGAKQGDTTIYDPFGNVVSGLPPDTLTGNLDIAGNGRLVDHEPPLQPITPDGYVPLLGRAV